MYVSYSVQIMNYSAKIGVVKRIIACIFGVQPYLF